MAVLVFALAGCGGGSGKDDTATQGKTGTATTASAPVVTGKLPPGVQPANPEEEAADGPAATEANPGVPAVGPKASGELSGVDRAALRSAVSY